MVTEVKPSTPTQISQRLKKAQQRNGPKISPEVGSSGLRRFSGYVSEDFDPNLNGHRAAAAFDEMRRNDPDVAAVLSAIEFIIHSVEWSVAPAGDSQADMDAAEFLRECMQDMDISWHDLISDICSMFAFGWALFEMVWKQRNGALPGAKGELGSVYEDGRIGWGKVALRGQESLQRWDFAENGDIKGMWQRVIWSPAALPDKKGMPLGGDYYIPMEKSVLFRVKREKNNPEGWSILRPAYRPYFIKKNIEEIEVQGAEKDMVGTLVIRLPANATGADANVAMRILEDYHSGDQTGIMLPRTVNDPDLLELDWKAELMKSPGSKVVDTDKIINRCSVMITRSSLAQFLTLGQNRAGGSRALGTSMMDLFNISVAGHLDNIEGTINRFMVRKLFEMNEFPGITGLPSIQHTNVGEMTMKEFVDSIAKLHNTGFPLKDPGAVNTTRKKLGLPELDPEYIEELAAQQLQQEGMQEWKDTGALSTQIQHRTVKTDNGTGGEGGKPSPRAVGAKAAPATNNQKPGEGSKDQPVRKSAAEWAEYLARE